MSLKEFCNNCGNCNYCKLLSANDEQEGIELINEIAPDWIISICEKYSKDYPTLENNWTFFCEKFGTKKGRILLVNKIVMDPRREDFREMDILCNILSKKGYIIRRKEEFKFCEKCNSVLPSVGVYNKLKENKITPIPHIWAPNCQNC
jgi:hypothetical protein